MPHALQKEKLIRDEIPDHLWFIGGADLDPKNLSYRIDQAKNADEIHP